MEHGATRAGATGDPRLRLAVIGTPRSGNTWVSTLLAQLFGLDRFAANRPEELDWDRLPGRSVVQLHWQPDSELIDVLRRHDVTVVTPARHPLDVLISGLNYAFYTHQEGHCPGGGACLECPIVGRWPRSPEHLAYACGPSGCLLFSYSAAWWARPDTVRVRYEDLVAEPITALERLVATIGEPARVSFHEALRATGISVLKPQRESWQAHYWQGQAGLWRRLLPAPEAQAIAAAHAETFAALGYACDADPDLDGPQADLNWVALQLDSTRENLGIVVAKHRQAARELAHVEGQRNGLLEQLTQAHAELARLAPLTEIGPRAMGLARGLTRLARRHPTLAAAGRRLIRRDTAHPSSAPTPSSRHATLAR